MWKWDQSAGKLYHDGRFVADGYSGRGEGKNNPELDHVKGIGPVPAGRWRIVGPPYDSPRVGRYVLALHALDETVPDDTHEATGRGAFRIHGDSISAPGTASHGCIILPRAVRQQIWESGDRLLEVVE